MLLQVALPFSYSLSVAPVYAQETTPVESLTPTPEQTIPTDSSTPTPTPTDEIATTVEATPTVEPTATPHPTDTAIPTPEVTVEVLPTETVTPTAGPTPEILTVTTSSEELGTITAAVVENVDLSTMEIVDDVYGNPTVSTDKADYAPTDVVVVTGSSLDANKEYTIIISSTDNPAVTHTDTTATDESGGFIYLYQLDGNYRPNYLVQVKDGDTVVAQTTFTDAAGPSVAIDQCDNGGIGDTPTRCANLGNPNNHWGSGNLNSSKAHWQEGDVLPYRAVMHNLNPGVNTVTFSFDTAKASELRHAIDYLASVDYTETTGAATATHANQIDPCGDVIGGCNPASPTAPAAITNPAYLTSSYPLACANGPFTGTPLPGQFIKAWSAAAGGVSAMSLSFPDVTLPTSGDCSPRFKVTFTVASGTSDVVIAWGGHVAANNDPGAGGYWGPGNSVPTGSPYHMHAGFQQESPLGTFFNVGNQDLQLASSAISAPGSIVVIKNTVGGNNTFDYTATGGGMTSPFTITTSGGTNSTTFSNLATGTAGGSRSVTEGTLPSGWGFTSLNCSVTVAGDGNTAYSISNQTVNVTTLGGGATLTCTYTNTLLEGTLKVIKHVINDDGGTAVAGDFNLHVKSGSTDVTGSPAAGSETGVDYTLVQGTYNLFQRLSGAYQASAVKLINKGCKVVDFNHERIEVDGASQV